MSAETKKPLKWNPNPHVGYTVMRRPDGGMHVTFHHVDTETLLHWRDFALEHLLDSDGLTRNLYDLREIETIPDEAMRIALEVSNDPAAGNIRLAVLVSNEQVRAAVEEIVALTTVGRARLRIFADPEEAEAWLSRPLRSMV